MKTPPVYAAGAAQGASGLGEIVLLLLILVALLVLVYYTTRLVGKFAARGTVFAPGKNAQFQPGRHIVLIDRLAIDRERAVLLLRVGSDYYLVGAAEGSVRLLEKVEIDESAFAADAEAASLPFKGVLEAWRARGKAETPQEGQRE